MRTRVMLQICKKYIKQLLYLIYIQRPTPPLSVTFLFMYKFDINYDDYKNNKRLNDLHIIFERVE